MSASIVVGIDFTDVSRRAFRSATALARDLKLPLVLVHAYGHRPVPATVPDETLQEFRRTEAEDLTGLVHRMTLRWAEEGRKEGIKVDVVVEEDDPAALMLRVAHAKDAAMLVVGTHARGVVARFLLGSVAAEVVRQSRRPVLVVPDPA